MALKAETVSPAAAALLVYKPRKSWLVGVPVPSHRHRTWTASRVCDFVPAAGSLSDITVSTPLCGVNWTYSGWHSDKARVGDPLYGTLTLAGRLQPSVSQFAY